jgi:uncharacterized GH25 family protein
MRASRLTVVSGYLFLALFSPVASAHYLWVVIDDREGDHGTAKIYFEHAAAPGDGHYLDHFTTGAKTWVSTTNNKKPRELSLEDVKSGENRWLQAALDEPAPRSVEMHGKFGVYFYGKTPVLLHYYGRNLQVDSVDELNQLARARHMDLEMIPSWKDGDLTISVFWKGHPVPDRDVAIFGPQKFVRKLKTDANGQVRFTPGTPGRYRIRGVAEVHKPGKDEDGQKYDFVRHNGTLFLDLPVGK